MSKYTTSLKIVDAVVENLASRKGLDLEEIIDDSDIYESLLDDLFELVEDILFDFEKDLNGESL